MAELKRWIISPTIWNGITQTPICHDGSKTWDSDGFTPPEPTAILTKKIRMEITGAAGLAGDYAARIWFQVPGQASFFTESWGRTIYWQGGDQSIRWVFDYTPDWVTLPLTGQLWFRVEAGFFPQLGAPSSQDNHAFYPQFTVYYTVP